MIAFHKDLQLQHGGIVACVLPRIESLGEFCNQLFSAGSQMVSQFIKDHFKDDSTTFTFSL